jgi:hypothetical protein
VIRRVVAGDSNLKLNPAFLLADDFDTLIFVVPLLFDSNVASVLHENPLRTCEKPGQSGGPQ